MSVQAIDWALRQVKGVSPTQKLILICLGNHAGPDGTCWPSQGTISEYSGLSRETIYRNLIELEELGFLSAIRRKDENGRDLSKQYRLNFLKTRGEIQNLTGERENLREGDAGSHPGETQSLTKQQQEPSTETKEKNNNKNGVVVAFSSSNERILPPAPLRGEKTTSQQNEGLERRLIEFGFTPGDAQDLIEKYPSDDIEGWCRAGAAGKKNPAGFIRIALEKGWKLPQGRGRSFGLSDPPEVEDAVILEERNKYKLQLDFWNSLSYEVKRKYLNDTKLGSFGSNSNFPDPEWLSKVISLEEKRKLNPD